MKENKKGIYKLWFEGSDRVYIGSAKNIESRVRTHVSDLLSKVHPNTYLTSAFNKYGLFNMRWEILEILEGATPKQILLRENYYIGKYKSNINGYNKATYTSSKKRDCYKDISSLATLEEYTKVINAFKKQYNIDVKKISIGLTKDEGISFSKYWYDKADENDLRELMNNIYNYTKNHVKQSFRNILIVMPSYRDSSRVKMLVETCCKGKIAKSVRKIYDEKGVSKPISTICVFGQLNPFHLEMEDMKKLGTLDAYRVYSLIRILENIDKTKDLSLCFPCGLYDTFIQYLG